MKVYAKQVNPYYQESPLWQDKFPDDIIVHGNSDYISHCSEVFNRVYKVLEGEELIDAIWDIEAGEGFYENVTEAIKDLLYSEKSGYSVSDINRIKEIALEYPVCGRREMDELICELLSIVTGKEWDYMEIHGNCRSEWNIIYYIKSEWDKTSIRYFEKEYFNTGTDWFIYDEDAADGYYMYCYGDDEEEIRQEIADETGVNAEEVILYKF